MHTKPTNPTIKITTQTNKNSAENNAKTNTASIKLYKIYNERPQ